MATVAPEVVEIWEHAFLDESTKDITVIAKDGSVKVHGMFLSALSDAFKAMLAHDLQEGRLRQVKLEHFTKDQLQFFFRFAYTGQVEPREWPKESQPALHPLLRSPVARPASWALTGMMKGCRKGKSKGKSKGKPNGKSKGELADSDDSSDDSDSISSIVLAPDDEPYEPMPSTIVPPLQLLMGAAQLSKQYEVRSFLTKFTKKLADALCSTNFDAIASFAINTDLSTLRMQCLHYAEESSSVWEKFKRGSLSPEVMFELQAIFPATESAEARRKKQKLFF